MISTKVNILYISTHAGTHSNFDGIAEKYDWNVTHMKPPHGYIIENREIAFQIWLNAYSNFIATSNFTHIIVSDTIINIFPFITAINSGLYHTLHDIEFILHITNYYDYDNYYNDEYHTDLRKFVLRENVKVFYVDRFIEKYLQYHNIFPKYIAYIPLSGMIGTRQHKEIEIPCVHGTNDHCVIYYNKITPYQSSNKFCIMNKLSIFLEVKNMLEEKIDLLPAFYGGVESLCNYYGLVYIPYHYSTISFHEFLAQGLIVLIPSPKLYKALTGSDMNFQLCDCYNGPLSRLAIHFDNINHLRSIITDFENNPDTTIKLKNQIKTETAIHDETVFDMWYHYVQQPFSISKYKAYMSPHGRFDSFSFVLQHFNSSNNLHDNLVIIELGTSRSYCNGYVELDKSKWDRNHPQTWDHGAGVFTYLFAEALPTAIIHTVDPDPNAIGVCKHMTSTFKNIEYHYKKSSEFFYEFKNKNEKAHVIYMDHGETNDGTSDMIHLKDAEFIVENDLLHPQGLIIIDDVNVNMNLPNSYKGKGNLSIPYFLAHGFKIVHEQYQVVLAKNIDKNKVSYLTPSSLTIALFNGLTSHHEMFGHVLEYCKERNYIPTIYVNTTGDYGWIDFYKNKFKDTYEQIDVYDYTLLKNNKHIYDAYFLLTDDDWIFPEHVIDKKKIICIDHDWKLRRHTALKRIDIRPFTRTQNDKWVLPIYEIINKIDKLYTVTIANITEHIHVACIGLGGFIDIDYMKKVFYNFDKITFHIFNREKIDTKGYNNIISYTSESSSKMISILKLCQYSLFIPMISQYYEHKMSGSVPLALSAGCRIITTPKLKELYKLKSCLVIETAPIILSNITTFEVDLVYEELQELKNRRNMWYDQFIVEMMNTL